ncbi:MAG TPA: SRPBCC family protein [Propionibacteriaceae bacterium]|jgi:uncharacterized protein YndB with AHSA1/START domain|nr:SRPBCC family protein [Propionibacteriaceae bacterium]
MTTATLPTDPNGTTIEADPDLPVITIVRDFAAPAERVYRAWTDPELVVKWMGPNETEMKIDRWEATTGGHYRYTVWQEGQEVAAFFGSFHEARPGERLVQTFTWEGMPDGVSLDTMTFADLGDGRSRVTSVSVVDSLEGRDAILASGMEVGVYEGYAKLDALLAD